VPESRKRSRKEGYFRPESGKKSLSGRGCASSSLSSGVFSETGNYSLGSEEQHAREHTDAGIINNVQNGKNRRV